MIQGLSLCAIVGLLGNQDEFYSSSPEFQDRIPELQRRLGKADPSISFTALFGDPALGHYSADRNAIYLTFSRARVTYLLKRGKDRREIDDIRFRDLSAIPKRSRPLTIDAAKIVAKRWIDAFLPYGYQAVDLEARNFSFTYRIAIQDDSRVLVNPLVRVSVQIDPERGVPNRLALPFYPVPTYVRPRTTKRLPEPVLAQEASRIFHAVAPRPGGTVNAYYVYQVPEFPSFERKELRQEDRDDIEADRPRILYWVFVYFPLKGDKWIYQQIVVDAISGRGLAWRQNDLFLSGTLGKDPGPKAPTLAGTWRTLDGKRGQLRQTNALQAGDTLIVMLTDPKGTLRSVAYDPKAGLIKVDDQVLKVDPILRKALPTKAPVQGVFGKPTK